MRAVIARKTSQYFNLCLKCALPRVRRDIRISVEGYFAHGRELSTSHICVSFDQQLELFRPLCVIDMAMAGEFMPIMGRVLESGAR